MLRGTDDSHCWSVARRHTSPLPLALVEMSRETSGYLEEVYIWVEGLLDDVLKELLEHAMFIDASFLQSLCGPRDEERSFINHHCRFPSHHPSHLLIDKLNANGTL